MTIEELRAALADALFAEGYEVRGPDGSWVNVGEAIDDAFRVAALPSDGVIVSEKELARALREWRQVYVDPADPDRWYEDAARAILAALRKESGDA